MNHHRSSGSRLVILCALAALILIGSAIYSNTLHSPFVLDDLPDIQLNPDLRLKSLSVHDLLKTAFAKPCNNRPIANLSFALNHYLHQYRLPGYHIINIVIHILNACILFFIFRITLGISAEQGGASGADNLVNPTSSETVRRSTAFWAAALWLAHPLHTNSVTYIVQRMTSMATLFFLLGMFCYLKGRMSIMAGADSCAGSDATTRRIAPSGWFGLSVCAWILALGSKEIAVTLPACIFLYEWLFFQNGQTDWLKTHLRIPALIAVVIILLGLLFLEFHFQTSEGILAYYDKRDFTVFQRLLTQCRVVIYYISLIAVPLAGRFTLDHDYPLSLNWVAPPTTFLCAVALICILFIAIVHVKRNRIFAFAIFWYLGNLIIESTVVPLEIIFEHRTYLPSMFFSLAVAMTIHRFFRSRRETVLVFVALLASLSLNTYVRNSIWSDKARLYLDVVRKASNKDRPHFSMGTALEEKGLKDPALRYFYQSYYIAPQGLISPQALRKIGVILVEKGLVAEALVNYGKAIYLIENAEWYLDKTELLAVLYYNVGNAFAKLNRFEEAVSAYRKALDHRPDASEVLNNLGNALYALGRYEEAGGAYREAIKAAPDYKDPARNLKHLESILHAPPENPTPPPDHVLQYRKGNELRDLGHLDEAVRVYENALAIKPDFAGALGALAVLLARMGKDEASISYFQRLAAIAPENAVVHYNLACMYSRNHQFENAVHSLNAAIAKGYDNWTKIQTDPDLERLRDSEWFQKVDHPVKNDSPGDAKGSRE